MKKSIFIVGIVILLIALPSMWLLTRPEVLGNMNHTYTEPTTSTSTFSFQGEAGDRIKFSFRSDIQNGDLEIRLYNSKGHMVFALDRAKALETYHSLDHADTYTLAAEYSDFVGQFKIKIAKTH